MYVSSPASAHMGGGGGGGGKFFSFLSRNRLRNMHSYTFCLS